MQIQRLAAAAIPQLPQRPLLHFLEAGTTVQRSSRLADAGHRTECNLSPLQSLSLSCRMPARELRVQLELLLRQTRLPPQQHRL